MNIVNDILVNTLFPDTDFIQTLDMNSVVPKYVENQEKGNPSVCKNCAEAPFRDLHIYGRSEQMTTTGAQILKLVDREPVTISGLTWQIKNQCISVNGTATEEGNVTDFYICGDRNVYEDADFPEGEITISADLPKDIVMYVVKKGGTVLTYITQQNKDGSFEHISGNKYRIMFRVMKKGAIYDNVIKVMFNTGSTALTWEPYTGGKPSPSPDYPQEIVSAGDGGSVAVKVTGKNLLDFLHAEITKAGWLGKFTRDEEILTISAVNGWNAYWFVSPVRGKQISVSFTYRQIDDKTFDDEQSLVVGTSAKPSYIKTGVYSIKSPKKSWTKIACTMISETYVGVMLRVKNEGVNEERTIEIKDFQLELGSTATAYSPYREQLLTLPTPNGLPGVPVTSGGNYTDPQGQQWICDEVDFGRGVYVQRVDKGAFDATKALTEQSVILATPIETPLTAAEIAAYKSLRTYRGTTIVEAEDKAGISVKYNMPMPKLSKNGALRRWFKRHPII